MNFGAASRRESFGSIWNTSTKTWTRANRIITFACGFMVSKAVALRTGLTALPANSQFNLSGHLRSGTAGKTGLADFVDRILARRGQFFPKNPKPAN